MPAWSRWVAAGLAVPPLVLSLLRLLLFVWIWVSPDTLIGDGFTLDAVAWFLLLSPWVCLLLSASALFCAWRKRIGLGFGLSVLAWAVVLAHVPVVLFAVQ